MSLRAELLISRAAFRLELSLTVAAGEVVALVGPNGAGKSTTLRALAGLISIDRGRVELSGRLLDDTGQGIHVEPHDRFVGVVFQDYLLFPHLSVVDNVAFGLRAHGWGRARARQEAAGWLAKVGLSEFADSRPAQVSGGQAQRVALARALAIQPQLLLLDEPLAALDARTRLLVRGELRSQLAEFEGPTVVITHDPIDAAVLADRLVVIEDGAVVQEGSPLEVARRPRTDYVARLVGLNLLAGVAEEHTVGLPTGGLVHAATVSTGASHAAFRPAAVSLFTVRPEGSPRNVWQGQVVGLEPHGTGVRVEIGGVPDGKHSIMAEITAAALAELDLAPGAGVWASVKASDVEVYPA